MGLGVFFSGFLWIQNCCDFLTILLTGKNIDITTYRILNIISLMWFPPAVLLAIYIGAELMIPDKKRYIVAIYGVLGVVFELFLFFDPSSFIFVYPEKSGENLVDDILVFYSPAGVISIILTLSLIIFCGFGILIKAFQLEGILKKKYLFFSIGFIIWSTFGMLDALIALGIALVFIRISLIISIWFWYLGLREESEKKEKIRPKKEVEVEGDLFRISKKPDHITEEEVSISKEKKICLVCKGKVSRVNYICPSCDALYCINCSEALSNLENACWVCNEPFDESKPVKPFKKEEDIEEIELEISEKPQKKPKTEK
jgi:hypothetical protein